MFRVEFDKAYEFDDSKESLPTPWRDLYFDTNG